MEKMISAIFNLTSIALFAIFYKKYLQIYQLKNYQNDRFLKYFLKKYAILMIFCIIFYIFLTFYKFLILQIISNSIFVILYIFISKKIVISSKTPLIKTNKIKINFTISLVFSVFLSLFYNFSIILFVFSVFMPIISNFLDFYSKIKNKKYIKSAINKLKNCKCKVIAITGSNGKTSTKNILCKMLSTTYKTQATPASYNTPLGISKFINQQLNSDTEILILEFGARRKNDIKKLCELFSPDYGIICNVSRQHLETFKSIDSVYITKKELSDYLKTNLCIYNLDNNFCKAMYKIKEGKKIGISITKNSNYCAKNIEIKNFFTEFDMRLGKHNIHTKTRLLGSHNVCNIMLASALAFQLSVKPNLLSGVIESLPYIPHRLEYIKGRINILDDSYNCSLASATASINVLKTTNFKTMIVTPGIIEAGKTSYSTNFELGKLLSNSNYCVIVGTENKRALTDGIKSTNYTLQNLFFAASLEDSKKYYNLLGENDTLLLLNDLPDDYK